LSMEEVIAHYRAWLGWKPARRWVVPGWVQPMLFGVGDFAGRLGWRPALRGTAAKEIGRGAGGDPEPWRKLTGIKPLSLSRALAAHPATVHDPRFANLFAANPLILVTAVVLPPATALTSLTCGYPVGVDLLLREGTGIPAAPGAI